MYGQWSYSYWRRHVFDLKCGIVQRAGTLHVQSWAISRALGCVKIGCGITRYFSSEGTRINVSTCWHYAYKVYAHPVILRLTYGAAKQNAKRTFYSKAAAEYSESMAVRTLLSVRASYQLIQLP